MKLTMWLKERELNARRLAAGKTGADRAGWMEDAEQFQAALAAVEERARLELQVRDLKLDHGAECQQLNATLADVHKAANKAVAAARTPPTRTHAGTAEGWDEGFKCGAEACAAVVWAAMQPRHLGPNAPAHRPDTAR